jgi:hypothetical protein
MHLEGLGLDGPQRRVPEAFEDGEALWEAVCEYELEGRGREAAVRALPAGRAGVGEGEEP